MHGTPYTTEFILNTIYHYISLRITITNRTNIESLKRNIQIQYILILYKSRSGTQKCCKESLCLWAVAFSCTNIDTYQIETIQFHRHTKMNKNTRR